MMGARKFGVESAFATIAERSGMLIFEPMIRTATGGAELASALLLIFPRARALGANAIIGGAIGFHLSPWPGVKVATAQRGRATAMLFFIAVGAFDRRLSFLSLPSTSRRAF